MVSPEAGVLTVIGAPAERLPSVGMSTPHDPSTPDDRYPEGFIPPPPAGWTYPTSAPLTGYGADRPRAASRPGAVVAAVACWVLAGLVTIGSGALTTAAARAPEARQEVAKLFAGSDVQFSDQELQQLLIATGLGSVALGMVTLVLGLVLLGGANWVRVLLTLVGVIDAVFVLFGAPFVIAALLLQFLPSSSRWFRDRAAPRAA